MAERRTLPGTMVGFRYELSEIAGEGGMATVWRALMHGAGGFTRPVAVKKMKPEFRAIKNYIDMFVEEARVGSELAHPNIAQVYDFCQDDDSTYYLVMEWVEGVDLHSFIYAFARLGERTPWAVVAAIGVGALRGLAAAHHRTRADGTLSPVIHRDISPQNILLGINGTVKLTDFGLARARDRILSLTGPGVVKGKLSYLAPEILDGKEATIHSDVFALGSTLWEALAGRRLFAGDSDVEIYNKIRKGQIEPLGDVRPDVPAELCAAIHRALEVEPSKRYPSARDFANALSDCMRLAKSVDGQKMLAETVGWAKQARSAHGAVTGAASESTWSFVIDVDYGDIKPARGSGGDSNDG